MNKKRIAIIVQKFPAASETFIVTKVLNLLENNYDVHIFTFSESEFWNHFKVLTKYNDIKDRVHISPFAYKNNYIKLLLKSMKCFCRAFFIDPALTSRIAFNQIKYIKDLRAIPYIFFKWMIVGFKPNLIHIEFDFQAYGLMDIKKHFHCPILLSGRGAINRTSMPYKYPGFYQYIYENVDHYHFISQYLYKQGLKNGLQTNIPVTFIEPAIDLSLFSPASKTKKSSTQPINIISVGRISWSKGYEFALDAISIVMQKFTNVYYHIFGDGKYSDAIMFAAHQHNLLNKQNCVFHGVVTREELIKALSDSDIMLHAALEEGFCNAVIEAQAMEIPIVTSDAGGLSENVADGITGFVVPRRDASAMAEKIIRLIEHPEERIAMGKEGRERVTRLFDLGVQKSRFATMYDLILK